VIGNAAAADQLHATLQGVAGVSGVTQPVTRDGLVYLEGTLSSAPDSQSSYDTIDRLYRRAAELFEQATAACPGGPWTLHQLRHSALTHAAEAGANTATLLAYSGHTSVASLARYARVSPEALARWQPRRDPAARRR
jgi:integrase